jgi:hypothetical protein
MSDTINNIEFSRALLPIFLESNKVTTMEKTLVTKYEEAIAGHFSWQKLLRKVRAHVGLSSSDDDETDTKPKYLPTVTTLGNVF